MAICVYLVVHMISIQYIILDVVCEQVVLIDVLGVASCQDYFLYK